MAMIVDSLASQLADTLASLIRDEITMMMSVKANLQKLERKVRMIHDVLEDAERKAIHDVAVRTWLTELRDAFYDADDIIDNSRTHAEGIARLYANQQVRCWTPLVSIHRRLLFRHRIGGRIQSLNARLDEIFKEKSDFDLSLNVSKVYNESIKIRRDSDPDVDPDIVGSGIENDTNELVRMMISSNYPTISVYGIVGMGGIGKTTLAQKINNHTTIKDNFHLPPPMWVSVSKDYSDEELLKSIIRHAGGNPGNVRSIGELQHILGQTVPHKKIFLVLDDVWDANLWMGLLRKPLLRADLGSIVLITTRDERVAQGMDAVCIHSVQPLPVDDGWSLICKLVFRTGEESEMQLLEPLGKQIVQKCHGHPLAIKTIAGVLRDKEKRPNAWERVLENPAWSITELPEGVMGVLYLSYEDLPSHLKQCFIFCSLFPGDHVLMRHTLIQYWVASGFVKEHNHMIMEEVAREYYRELLRRNLLQRDPHYYGEGGCKMHNLLHSLAKFLAQGEYFIGDVLTLSTTASSSPTMKLRHLSISVDAFSETFPEIVKEQTSVRTFLFNGILTMYELPEDLFQKLKCLRLLDVSNTIFEVVPESISSLVHLRYLDFSRSMICELPDTIGNLSNLQYLILQRCEELSELPKSIANLYKLRSIDLLGTPVIGIPAGIRGLIHLNRVIDFVTNEITDGAGECYSSLEDIKSLLNLRTITIVNLEKAARAEGSILKDKTHIYHLELSCSSDEWPYQQEDVERIQDVFEERLFPPHSVEKFEIKGYFGLEFPAWMKNINLFLNLTRLDISKCRSCSQLPPLGQLPLLDLLNIKGAWSIKHIGPEFMGSGREAAFPKLKSLTLKDMPEWEEWTWEAKDGARMMPVLESLEVSMCPQLKSLPQGLLYHATKLTSLGIKESHRLTVIEGFKSVKVAFLIGNNGLERVSDFPVLQAMKIDGCPALLHHVGVLPSMQILEWGDSSMKLLPEWMLPHPTPIFPTLQRIFIVVGDVLTLRRCLIDGPDWPKIQHIPNVFIGVMNRQEFISYTKEPFSFDTNINAVSESPPLPGNESDYNE